MLPTSLPAGSAAHIPHKFYEVVRISLLLKSGAAVAHLELRCRYGRDRLLAIAAEAEQAAAEKVPQRSALEGPEPAGP